MFDAVLLLFYLLFFLSLVWPLVFIAIMVERKRFHIYGGELLALATFPASLATLSVMAGGLRLWDVAGYIGGYALLLFLLAAVLALASILHLLLSMGRPRPKRPRSGGWMHWAGVRVHNSLQHVNDHDDQPGWVRKQVWLLPTDPWLRAESRIRESFTSADSRTLRSLCGVRGNPLTPHLVPAGELPTRKQPGVE